MRRAAVEHPPSTQARPTTYDDPPVDVSVVIPTHRRERFVVEAVESALHQPGVRVEVLVLDDSPDGSSAPAIAAIADARVRYLRRSAPSGGKPSLVRNEGMRLARGRFLVFLDDDDRLAEGALAALVSALERHGSAGVAFGVIAPFSESGAGLPHEIAYFQRAAARLRASRTRFDLVARLLFKDAPIANSGCMVRAEDARAVGGYDPRIEHCEDADFYARAARSFGFVFVDRTVVHKRTGIPSRLGDLGGKRRALAASYRVMHESYKASRGRLEFYALELLGRLLR
jgi:glycosyltransferase involved in cell wall biosynthesis